MIQCDNLNDLQFGLLALLDPRFNCCKYAAGTLFWLSLQHVQLFEAGTLPCVKIPLVVRRTGCGHASVGPPQVEAQLF